MKKLYNLFACVVLGIAVAFTSCKPLDKTFDGIGPKPVATAPPIQVNAAITLGTSDYALLPSSNPANAAQSFADSSSAINGIPTILAAKYPNTADKSSATITFSFTTPAAFTATDNLITDIAYTASDDDYTAVLGVGYKYKELNTTQAETVLGNNHYNKEGSIVMFTYIFYESGVVSKATTLTDTFIFLNSAWIKCYSLTAAQFASVGNTFGDFSASDDANIPAYLSAILGADLGFTAKAKSGQVVYVAYKYFSSSKNYQHTTALVYNGVSHRWVSSLPPVTFTFTYSSTAKAWVSSLSSGTNYTLIPADYTAIAGYTDLGASDAAKANLAQFGDFSLSGASVWTDDQITAGIAERLKVDYPAATKGQVFVVTYHVYSGGDKAVTKTYTYDGSKFALGTGTPTGGGTPYTLISADYATIAALTTTGASDAAKSNLAQFGDFSLAGASAWTNPQIAIGIATVLKQKNPTATANQLITVTYEVYSGGASNATMTFKFDGTNWIAQ